MQFNAVNIFGANSSTNLHMGELQQRAVRTSLPGVDGGGVHLMGLAPISYTASVVLLEDDDAAMLARIVVIRNALQAGAIATLIDDNSSSYLSLVFLGFRPQGRREVIVTSSRGSITRMQKGTARFEQLDPT